MFKLTKPIFLICESPLHAGSGDDLGVVDLPIQRERHTGYPKIEGSGLKGSLREAFESKIGKTDEKVFAAFGPESDAGSDHAGALAISDARLLLFPVKSVRGVFGWVTCRRVLKQFAKDLGRCSQSISSPTIDDKNTTLVPSGSGLRINGTKKIVLEEYAFDTEESNEATAWAEWLSNAVFVDDLGYWKEKLTKDLVILSDDDFRDFVELSTEVITRTQIDNEKGTVKDGALFTEEFLPSDSVLYTLVLASHDYVGEKKIFKDENATWSFFESTIESKLDNFIQVGGNATLGKGIIRTKIYQNGN